MGIRPATKNDLPAILDIFNHEVIYTPHVYLYNPWSLDYIQNWFENKRKHDFPLLVAESEEGILGYATYGKFREKEAYHTSVEYSVYIHNKHRRKGIAKELVLELISIGKTKGIHSIIGGVDAGNKESHHFHSQLGFKQVGYLSQVAKKFDKWLDLVFFQLILTEEKHNSSQDF